MTYLLDTCTVSELSKPVPNIQIVQWFDQQSIEQLFLSYITVAEIKLGIYKIELSQPKRYHNLQQWLTKIEDSFFPRILPLTNNVFDTWAKLAATAQIQGRTLSFMDSLIASTALVHNMTVVTRNVKDFEQTGVRLLNPWEES